jgi:hypothetical protein
MEKETEFLRRHKVIKPESQDLFIKLEDGTIYSLCKLLDLYLFENTELNGKN